MTTCQHVNMSTCQHVNMATCQHGNMATCHYGNKSLWTLCGTGTPTQCNYESPTDQPTNGLTGIGARQMLSEKNGIMWEKSPNRGEVSPNSTTSCQLTKLFLARQNHSEGLKHVWQKWGSDMWSIWTRRYFLNLYVKATNTDGMMWK